MIPSGAPPGPNGKRNSGASKPKQAPKAKHRKLADDQSVDPSKTEKPDKTDKSFERTEALLGNVQKTKDSLVELTPESIWRSLIRTSELERRLGKVGTCERDLQKVGAGKADQLQKARAAQLQDEIQGLAEAIGAMKQFCGIVRGEAPALIQDISTGQDLAKFLGQCAHKLLSDFAVVIDIVHAISKKLLEASSLRGNGKGVAVVAM